MKLKLWVVILLFALHSDAKHLIPTLFVDTDGKEEHHYRNLLLLANSVGFKPQFKNLYDILEDQEIDQFRAIFFLISPNIIKHLDSELAQKIVQKMATCTAAGNKTIGILLPHNIQSNVAINRALTLLSTSNLFNEHIANTTTTEKTKKMVKTFLQLIGKHDALKGRIWGTTLINQQAVTMPRMVDQYGNKFTQWLLNNRVHAALLPRQQQEFAPLIQKSLPAGLFVHNAQLNNHYFISKISEFNFADINENFFKNPIDFELREQLLKVAQEMLFELHNATINQGLSQASTHRPALPQQLTTAAMRQQKQLAHKALQKTVDPTKYGWILSEGLSVAWLDPDDLSGKNYPQKNGADTTLNTLIRNRGINIIYNAQFNLLWFEYNPEWYLSINAIRKEQKEEFIKETQTFMTALQKKFNAENRPLPRIFVGTDITSNFKKNPVHEAAQDIWGNDYSKIPSPLDFEHFWKPEVLDTFDLFCDAIGKDFPIDGIFFDFEMYHAQNQASEYNDLMDFSDTAWRVFMEKIDDQSLTNYISPKERVNYLQENKLFKKYFAILQQEARTIGQKIKEHLRSKFPAILMGAYAANACPGRFYRGLIAGLSSAQEPLIFATFNTDYYSHHEWLKTHGVHTLHGTALLLSKLNNKKDFNVVTIMLKHHDFVWYNRPSRMALDLDAATTAQQWWAAEASAMPIGELTQQIAHH